MALLLASAAAPGVGLAQNADSRYQTLLTAAQATGLPADKPVDWQALRFAFADRSVFSPEASDDEAAHARKMREDYQSGDYVNAIAEAKLVSDADFVDPEAHLIASQAYAKSGDGVGATRERTIALGLLKSIQTGDGQSAGQAYTVIRVKEEYVLMATYGRRVARQSLQQVGGHSYDVLETIDRAGAPATFYFLIDRVLAAEANVLRLPGAK